MSRPWSEAMHDALYRPAPAGFYRTHRGADHFRTSVSAAPVLLARAVRTLAERVDAGLGRPARFDVVDVGAGDGALLSALAALPGLPARWVLTGVEVGARPVGLPADVAWVRAIPQLTGLLLANEWLDVAPVEVLFDGRLVEVEPGGRERLGGPAAADDLAWAARWWPAGRRVEVGRARDRAWAQAVGQVERGVAVAADYAHVLGAGGSTGAGSGTGAGGGTEAGSGTGAGGSTGADGGTGAGSGTGVGAGSGAGGAAWLDPLARWAWGDRRPTLTGYRDGRRVPPLADGSCDLTAHVAIDACRAAGGGGRLCTQRAALQALGVDAAPPPRALADDDPHGYLALLRDAGAGAELLEPRGLGGFAWLVRCVEVADPFSEPSTEPIGLRRS